MKRIAFLAALVAALTLPQPAAAATDWDWPVRGDVITPYRNGDDPYAAGQHRGIDIAAPVGTRVASSTRGHVTYVGVVGSSGLTVSVRTDDDRFDLSYLHLSSAAVHEGESIDRGDDLGAVGTSGRRSSERPHLHFGVREAGDRHAYRDPLDFLPPIGAPAREPQPPATAPAPAPAPADPAPAPALGRAPTTADVVPAPAAPALAPSPFAATAGTALPASDAGLGAQAAPALGAPPSTAAAPTSTDPRAPQAKPPTALERPTPGHASAGTRDHGRPDHRQVTRSDLTDGTTTHASPDTTARTFSAPDRKAARPPDAGGIDVGWLAALIGLIVAATCIGHPTAPRRAARGGRAAARAALRPLLGRG